MKDNGFLDYVQHLKDDDADEPTQVIGFPFTRYDNILNRPKVVTDPAASNNPDFALLQTDEVEVEDEDVFDLFGVRW